MLQCQVWTHDLPLADVGLIQKRSWMNGREDASQCHGRNFLFDENQSGSNTHALAQLKPKFGHPIVSISARTFSGHSVLNRSDKQSAKGSICWFEICPWGAIECQRMGTIFCSL